MSSAPTLDGRIFQAVGSAEGGEAGPATVFKYREVNGLIEADYGGGAVARGFLVGTRSGDSVSFRYCQLNTAGETSTGRCDSTIEVLADGRLRLHETWVWESRPGAGTSFVEEMLPASQPLIRNGQR